MAKPTVGGFTAAVAVVVLAGILFAMPADPGPQIVLTANTPFSRSTAVGSPTATTTPITTLTPTLSPTTTATPTVTTTLTPTATGTPATTLTPTLSPTTTATPTVSITLTPTTTGTPATTVTLTPSPTATPTRTVVATWTPTITPTAGATPTARAYLPYISRMAEPIPTPTPTPTPTPIPILFTGQTNQNKEVVLLVRGDLSAVLELQIPVTVVCADEVFSYSGYIPLPGGLSILDRRFTLRMVAGLSEPGTLIYDEYTGEFDADFLTAEGTWSKWGVLDQPVCNNTGTWRVARQ